MVLRKGPPVVLPHIIHWLMGYLSTVYLLLKPCLRCDMEELAVFVRRAVRCNFWGGTLRPSVPSWAPGPIERLICFAYIGGHLIIPAPPASPGCQQDKVGWWMEAHFEKLKAPHNCELLLLLIHSVRETLLLKRVPFLRRLGAIWEEVSLIGFLFLEQQNRPQCAQSE